MRDYKDGIFYLNGEPANYSKMATDIGIVPKCLLARLNRYTKGKITKEALLCDKIDKRAIRLSHHGAELLGSIPIKGCTFSIYKNGAITYDGSPVARLYISRLLGITRQQMEGRIRKYIAGKSCIKEVVQEYEAPYPVKKEVNVEDKSTAWLKKPLIIDQLGA